MIYSSNNDLTDKTKIILVEPNPKVRTILEKNAVDNSNSNITIIVAPYAISDSIQEQYLYDHNNDMVNGGIIHKNLSANIKSRLLNIGKNKIKCKCITLELLCKKYFTDDEINNISFIKIDAEGYDREIIKSSKHFLNKYKPVLYIEWFDFYNTQDSKLLFDVIKDINYIPFNPLNLTLAQSDSKIHDLLLINKFDLTNLAKC